MCPSTTCSLLYLSLFFFLLEKVEKAIPAEAPLEPSVSNVPTAADVVQTGDTKSLEGKKK